MIILLKRTILIGLLIALSYLGILSYQQSKLYEENTHIIAQECDANGLASGKIDSFTSIISFGLVKDKHKLSLDKKRVEQQKSKKLSQRYLYYFMGTLALILIFSLSCTLRGTAIVLSFTTFISLILGLISPILMVTIHKEVEYLGDVILSFESKGIIGSINKLFESGESVVAFTILLFSILLPLLKSLTLTFTLMFQSFSGSGMLVKFFKLIGKWSMLDVFVVAIFLVYLTSNGGGLTKAEIQVGLYFFLTYVILSMITAILTQKVLERK